MLEMLSDVAAAAHAPFIAGASPKLFDLDSFTELGIPRDLAKGFETTELDQVALVPRDRGLALRRAGPAARAAPPAVRPGNRAGRRDRFRGGRHGTDHSKYLWGNAAYALGQRITNAFAQYGWTAAIRGVEGGGVVEGLPAHTFKTDRRRHRAQVPDGDRDHGSPGEGAERSRASSALCHCKGTDFAAFFGGQTTNKPKQYNTDAANANARISRNLPYVLAASRFAHYFKAMMRDKVGSFMTRDNVRDVPEHLDRRLRPARRQRAAGGEGAYPLREARVDVTEIPGKPGATGPSRSCGRTSSSKSSRSPCAWWRSCRSRSAVASESKNLKSEI